MFKRFLVGFIFSTFLFIFIILLFDMMNQMKYFLRNNVSFGTVLQMYYYKAYLQFTIVSPAAALFSTVFAINSLAKNNELIAIVNSGMSIYRLTFSIAIFGLFFSLFLVPFNDYVVFPAQKKAEKISDIARRKFHSSRNRTDIKVWGENELFYKARYYKNKQQKLMDLVVLKMRKKKEEERIDRVPFYPDKKVNIIKSDIPDNTTNHRFEEWRDDRYLNDVLPLSLSALWRYRVDAKYAIYNKERKGWYLFDGVIWDFNKVKMKAHRFKKRFFSFVEIPYDFARESIKVNSMTTAQAKRYIAKLKKSGESFGKEQVEYYLKYSFPLVNFVIILIGISLGGFSSKSVVIRSFFISISIYLLYYTFVAIGLSLGKLGSVSPVVGAWLGDVLFAILAIILLIRRKT